MYRIQTLLLLIILLVSGISALAQVPILGEKIKLYSTFLQEEQEIWLSLPYHYQRSQAAFPVIYVFDGDGHFNTTANCVQYLANNYVYQIPQSIVVGIRSLSTPWRGNFMPEADTSRKVNRAKLLLQFMQVELLPYIEKHYRTLPHRTLIGHSAGATFSTYAWLKAPDLFRNCLAISPSLGSRMPILLEYLRKLKQQKGLSHRQYHLSTAENDLPNYTENAQIWNDSLRQLLDAQTNYSFHLYPQKTHYNLVPNAIFDGILALYQDWEFGVPPNYTTVEGLDESLAQQVQRFGIAYPPELAYHRAVRGVIGLERWDLALQLLTQWQKAQPRSSLLHRHYASFYFLQKKRDKALEHIQVAIAEAEKMQNPDLPEFIQFATTIKQTP